MSRPASRRNYDSGQWTRIWSGFFSVGSSTRTVSISCNVPMSLRLNRECLPLHKLGAYFCARMFTKRAACSKDTSHCSHEADDVLMPWSMTYVATPIAVAVREGCFTPS